MNVMKVYIWGKDPDRPGNVIISPVPDDGRIASLPQAQIRFRSITPWGHVAVISTPLDLIREFERWTPTQTESQRDL